MTFADVATLTRLVVVIPEGRFWIHSMMTFADVEAPRQATGSPLESEIQSSIGTLTSKQESRQFSVMYSETMHKGGAGTITALSKLSTEADLHAKIKRAAIGCRRREAAIKCRFFA